MAHAGGRPVKFGSREELQTKINNYFKECKENELPITITGLALALDTNRQTLINYGNKDDFYDIIEKAKLTVENSYELRLIESGRSGDIFALKNFGWTDRQEIDSTVKVNKTSFDELIESIDNMKSE